ncbi:tetratricopeptide repeat protein [Hymenobacter aerilatus]|uniref:Tetratricopeptide repeat protein n=1 Tax=Hymenobacter aerilatus TaxID=2932251 RepID=A0A8T9SZT5_9BACT|nr:tetratricopeptide repeat protein [Hymenobacter aerilatus]UOR06891.1 tetratricopeptide repeat protein [Hymenobacter aerilatus]
MKKLVLTLVAAAALTSASAQNSAVNNALLYQKQGTLDKARTEIDKAITNDKTKDKAKTWYTRGEIYDAMTSNPIYGKTLKAGEGMNIAYESYQKAIQLDGKDGEFGKQAAAKMQGLYGLALNAGVENYNAKNYAEAIKSYEMAQQMNPQDTTAYLYAAYASLANENTAGAKQYYGKLMAMNYKSPTMYSQLMQIARQENNTNEYNKLLQSGLQAYPNNKTFVLEDLNQLITAGKDKEAISKLQHAIELDPKNSNLQSVLGSVYDKLKQPEQAEAAYKKAIELDANNFDAQYNLGVYYYNKAAELYTKASKMDLATYQKSGKALEANGKKYFQQSLPYFEKALELQPNEKGVIVPLQKVYVRLGRNADADRLNAKLEGK